MRPKTGVLLGVKVNKQYFWDILLSQNSQQNVSCHETQHFVFQQNNAETHHVRNTSKSTAAYTLFIYGNSGEYTPTK